MPKQIGPHQLRGTMNNVCYYQQKGVRTGLSRRINTAMSERLRSGVEYSNTRTANSFFGGCSLLASSIITMLGTRATYYHKFDRQSIMTKGIFELVRGGGVVASTDNITLVNALGGSLSYIYRRICKNPLDVDFPEIQRTLDFQQASSNFDVVFSESSLRAFCLKNGVKDVHIDIVHSCYVYNVERSETGKFATPLDGHAIRPVQGDWNILSPNDLTLSVPSFFRDGAKNFIIIVISPLIQKLSRGSIVKKSGVACGMVETFKN